MTSQDEIEKWYQEETSRGVKVLTILKDLKAQTGKGSAGRKMEILEREKDNQDLKDFFYWALEPGINYWQKKIQWDWSDEVNQAMPIAGIANFHDAMGEVISNLSTRAYTGNEAKYLLYMYCFDLTPEDQELMNRIITRKPDVGFNVSTVNKVWPKLVYDPAYMRCDGYSPKRVADWDFENDWTVSQVKADGMFVNIFHAEISGELCFQTRSGEDLDKVAASLPHSQKAALAMISGVLGIFNPVLHGELVVWKDGVMMERSKSNGIINKVKLGGEWPEGTELRISLWDAIPGECWREHLVDETPYRQRFEILEMAIRDFSNGSGVELIEYRFVRSAMEAQQHFIECLQRGLEGTVLKHGRGLWKYHTSPNQLKLKNKFRFEMRVTGFTKGEGKFAKTFGSMIIESQCGELVSAISGMTDKVRNYIHEHREEFLNSVVEVEANGLFINDDDSYGLMHPRFKEHRADRLLADTLERIIQQEQDAILGKEIEKDDKKA
ncbi:MAG: hypothetical protein GY799_21165 [Desulfobulbaceae bacterium]|nr:hypothetical protein [Desulfobulbaceae bacterium]